MKKNLMSVIILALLVVNLFLTAVLMFTIYPQSKAANELITKVCNAIQLDLESGEANGLSNIPIEKIVTYAVGEGSDMTINLAKGDDGKDHYAVIAVSISVNSESEVYKKHDTTLLSEKEAIIKDAINSTVRGYTKEEFDEDNEGVKKKILERLRGMFGADYVVGVAFTKNTSN